MAILSNQPSIAYADSFFKACDRLSGNVMKDVVHFTHKFLADPTSRGINYEKIHSVDGSLRSVRINGSYRAIVRIPDAQAKNTYFLLWVDAHDDAYDWAKRKTILHDVVTNSISLVEVVEKEDVVFQSEPTETSSGLFDFVNDEMLASLGFESNQYFIVRAIKNIEQLEDSKKYFPPHAFECLSFLVADIPYEEVLQYFQDTYRATEATMDIGEALEEDINRNQFFLTKTPQDKDLLEKYFNGEIADWRIFLHPKQTRYVEADYDGPVRIVGGPGTGKTVVAMHRAKHLLEHVYNRPEDRILFTTFSSNLAEDIDDMLKNMLDPQDFLRIDVINLDKLVHRIAKKAFSEHRIIYGDEVKESWQEVFETTGAASSISPDICMAEFEKVILPEEIKSAEEYFRVRRIGRGIALNRRQKKLIWDVVESYLHRADDQKLLDVHIAEKKVREHILMQYSQGVYVSIVADEVQDFRLSSLSLLRALAGPEKKNDLFLVGDNFQRIFRQKVELEDAGVYTNERRFVLVHNYRNTEEIADFARKIVKGFAPTQQHKEENPSITIPGKHGKQPVLEVCSTFHEELESIIRAIKRWLALGKEERAICVMTRTKNELKNIKTALNQQGLQTYEIKPSKKEDKGIGGIRLSTMHRAKGLEFDCVVLSGMEENNMPNQTVLQSAQDSMEQKEAEYQERLLLYVAVTRARQELLITGKKRLSPFLQGF